MARKKIIQNADADFNIDLAVERSNGIRDPFDLSDADLATSKVCFEVDGVKIEKFLDNSDVTVVAPSTSGKLEVRLQETETDTFPEGAIGDIAVLIKLVGPPTKDVRFQIIGSFEVEKKIC